VALSPPHT